MLKETGLNRLRIAALCALFTAAAVAVILSVQQGRAASPLEAGAPGGSSGTVPAQATPIRPEPGTRPHPQGTPARPVGLPAITPRGKGVGPMEAAFTADDVVRFVAVADGRSVSRRINANKAPTVSKVEFITEAELKARTAGEGTGLPDDALLCYVELSGDFTIVSPFGKSVNVDTAIQVFDATTGNLMMSGAGAGKVMPASSITPMPTP
jgi:hypothetical protein